MNSSPRSRYVGLVSLGNAEAFTLILAAVIVVYAHARDPRNVSNRPPSLIVYPTAKNIHYNRYQTGRALLSYSVADKYPGEGVRTYVSSVVAGQGWSSEAPIEERIEVQYSDAEPPTRVHRWVARWVSKNGDIVWYEFRYEFTRQPFDRPNASQNNSQLEVIAFFVPTRS
jgi:hypothetical protein